MEMKKNVGIDALLPYPNFSEEFIIHTDSRKSISREWKANMGSPLNFN